MLKRFNDYIADKLSLILSMMTTFYIVTALVIIPLFYPGAPTTLVTWAQYLCSVVFQGIALPVLGYTARKSSDKSDKMMEHILKLTKDIDVLVKHIESQEVVIESKVEEILRKTNEDTI
jgi:Mn2+/Fe2+ NRAMP family transporter